MTNRSNTQTSPRNKRATSSQKNTAFEIDPELLSPSYNQLRKPRLPYGIVVNDHPAGILIPDDQLETAGWLNPPQQLDTITLGDNEVTGLFLTDTRLCVLAFINEYIRYKDAEQLAKHGIDEQLATSVIGPYEEFRSQLDKGVMDVCSEHAIIFLGEDNRPLHALPIVIRFKNVSLWSLRSTMEDYYRKLEKAFAEFVGQPFSGKSDRWRSLGILPIQFKAEKQGQGKNKSWCCKSEITVVPTTENLPELFLGRPTDKSLVWGFQEEIAGFSQLVLSHNEVTSESTKALPASNNSRPKGRTATAEDLAIDEDEDDNLIDIEAESEDEDWDFEDEDEDEL